MKKYLVATTETLLYSCEYYVEAESEEDAISKLSTGELENEDFLEVVNRTIESIEEISD